MSAARPLGSVIVPAHDEAAVIARCLGALLEEVAPGTLDVVVACNGCTDATAAVAREWAPLVRVLELPVAENVSVPVAMHCSLTRSKRCGLPVAYAGG